MDRLDEIIEALEQTDEIGVAVGRDEALLIARLLRAGAKMRMELESARKYQHYVNDTEELYRLPKSCAAWDAALGGEDVQAT